MDQPRLPPRRHRNLVGNGYRIYSNPHDFDPTATADHREKQYAGRFGIENGVVDRGSSTIGRGRGRGSRTQFYDAKQERGQAEGGKERDDLQRAATLLAKRAPSLFGDLCESCLHILQERLSTLSSGGSLDLNAIERDENVAVKSVRESPGAAVDVSMPNSAGTFSAGERSLSLGLDNTEENTSSNDLPLDPRDLSEYCNKQFVDSKSSAKHEQVENHLWQQATKGEEEHDDNVSAVTDSSVSYIVAKMASQSLDGNPGIRAGKVELAEKAGLVETAGQVHHPLRDVSEHARLSQVGRKKDFISLERVNGKVVNVVEGLELHTNVLNDAEQKDLVNFIYYLQEQGRNQKLRKRTYSEPRKWMRGKGRVTIQFGCCYNYAVDKDGNPPGIVHDEEVDPIPQLLRTIIKRLVRWHILPRSSVPDSCIINIYDVGDCIPPHIDHHDFFRPFCTVSLLSECNIVFGSNLKIVGPGEFEGSMSIPLPTGSVLVLNGNGADVAKHAVPAVPTQRISITFRKMDPSKVPEGFSPDPELLNTQPLLGSRPSSSKKQSSQLHLPQLPLESQPTYASKKGGQNGSPESLSFTLETDFPPLQVPRSAGKYIRF